MPIPMPNTAPNCIAEAQVARARALATDEVKTRPFTEGERQTYKLGFLAGVIQGVEVARRTFCPPVENVCPYCGGLTVLCIQDDD